MKTINISDELHKELKLYALQHGMTVRELIEASAQHLITQKPVLIEHENKSLKDKLNSLMKK